MNYIWPDFGNKKAIEILEKNISNKKIANSYIFSGIKDLGKFSLAKAFARNIFVSCQPDLANISNILDVHSDFFVVEKEIDKKNISIEQIRSLISSLSSGSFLNSYRVIIIKDAENLNQNSANALLKILEDFKDKLVIILTTNNIDFIPKTVISRSQIINLHPLDFDDIYNLLSNKYEASPSEAKNFARLSLGKPVLALKFLEDKEYYNSYKEIVEYFLLFFNSTFFERNKLIGSFYKNDISQGGDFELLAIWDSLLRDLIFINYGLFDLVQNEFALEKLRSLNLDSDFFIKNKEVSKNSSDYFNSNFNIKSILEYVAINI